jgi:hypothetical protein
MSAFLKSSVKLTIATLVLAWAAFPWPARAETTCVLSDCVFKIKIKIVAVGGGEDPQAMNRWIADIISVWNGPVQGDGDSPTHGDCKCDVSVEVDFPKYVDSCSDSEAQGYHCVEITPGYARDTSGKLHRAYMRGVSKNGSSISGWWSSAHMNTPAWIGPGEGMHGPPVRYDDVHDAAHEAGHMMGLDDVDPPQANIMGMTWGAAATPTQAQIDQIVENNCEPDECPDECCCPNGQIDSDKNEECDPEAIPDGCKEPEWCFDDCTCDTLEDPCGDGTVEEPYEECDPAAEPTGCDQDETCSDQCVCEPKPPPPTTQIISPADGSTITEVTTVTATAESQRGILSVRFFLDGESQDEVLQPPYQWDLDPFEHSPGLHDISVKAYDFDLQTAEDSIKVTIEPVLTVRITNPEPDAILTEETVVEAEVTSNADVESVTYFVDGLARHEDLEAPYAWIFDPALYPPPGPHAIAVEAVDTSGGTATDEISVIVDVF